MNELEYRNLVEVEDTMWWFRGLHSNLFGLVERFVHHRRLPLLDAGCGTGGFLRSLQQRGIDCELYGIDVFPGAVISAHARTQARVVIGSVDALPFPSAKFGCIESADVICQSAVDRHRAIKEFFRCLAPEGYLIVQVPAYMWLWSYHDVQCKTAKRFTRRGLEKDLIEHGFRPVFSTYWNMILFPFLAVRRKVLSVHATKSDVKRYPMLIDRFFRALVLLESKLISSGFRLHYGSSVVVVARKPT